MKSITVYNNNQFFKFQTKQVNTLSSGYTNMFYIAGPIKIINYGMIVTSNIQNQTNNMTWYIGSTALDSSTISISSGSIGQMYRNVNSLSNWTMYPGGCASSEINSPILIDVNAIGQYIRLSLSATNTGSMKAWIIYKNLLNYPGGLINV